MATPRKTVRPAIAAAGDIAKEPAKKRTSAKPRAASKVAKSEVEGSAEETIAPTPAPPSCPAVVASAEAAAAEVASATETSAPRAGDKTKTLRPASLVQRVYKTIDGELGKLEKQEGLKSQDRERASRALSQMVNALEKAVDMQRVMIKRSAKGGDAKSKEALAHAEDLRREIAERLDRLNRKRPPGRSPE